MGGLIGHISFLSDNPDLKFSQIKDILTKASNGELVGTEKTDGQQIMLSYSVKDKEAKAARNKGNIRQGGMNIAQLSDKFSGRGSLQSSFEGAMNIWETTIQSLSPQIQKKIFGPDADVWFNTEIQDPGTANVINYDNKNLTIHQAGHAKYDKKTGKTIKVDVSKNVEFLTNAIENSVIEDDPQGFKITKNAIIQLRALDDDVALKNALSRIEKLLNNFGISDNQTVGDYINIQLDSIIEKNVPNLPKKTKELLVGKISGQKGLNINKITKLLPPDQSNKAKLLSNNAKNILKKIVFPLEKIIHDFTVEMLRGLESAFILDNKKETDRLRDEVDKAIKIIQQSGETEAIKILNQQLKKLKKVENISTAVEGFVFDYNGVVYKFTGNFAPINQILGLFRFGRGKKIPPMKHLVKESAKNRIIALVPGGYKPPHAGHYLQAKYFADLESVDEVIVIISPKSRFDSTKTVEITAQQSVEVWGVFAKEDHKIKIKVADTPSPVKAVYDYLENNTNPGDTVILGVSDKEAKEQSARYKNAEKFVREKNLNVKVDIIATPIIRMSSRDVSSTDLREMISQGKKDDFVSYMPNHLSEDDKEQIWHITAGNKKNDMGAGNPEIGYLGEMDNNKEEQEYTLDEISAMAAGNIEGGIIGFDSKKKEKNKKNYKENIIVNREEFLKELKLRNIVRSAILENQKNGLKKEIEEEIKLRSYIQTHLLKEQQDVEDAPHDSTGINVLEDLLKKIIPIIEQGYKILTTKKEQRDSFRAHILNAVQKSITQADITDTAGALDVMTEEIANLAIEAFDDEDIDIKVGDTPENDEKFIDIDNQKQDNEGDKEKEKFSLEGEDETGRDMAQTSYEKVENSILDSYAVLSDPNDKRLFYDYLLANMKLYFDKFESELSPDLMEPNAGDEATKDTFEPDEIGGEEDLVPEI